MGMEVGVGVELTGELVGNTSGDFVGFGVLVTGA